MSLSATVRAALPLSALLLACEAAAGEVSVEAPVVELNDGVATGEGGVVVTMGDQTIEGERFTYNLATGHLEIERGLWRRAEGELHFQRAVLDLPSGVAVALDGQFISEDGRLHLRGEALDWSEGAVSGRGVRFTTCNCASPPWEVEAGEVHVEIDEVARFSGAWVLVCGAKVLPVPVGRVPLAARKTGLLPPHVGYSEDGLRLGQPVYLVLGPAADLTLEPELRTAKGIRLVSELRYALPEDQGGQVTAAGGWDLEQSRARGALDIAHGSARDRWRAGLASQLWSDEDYFADYADTYLGRRAPWAETLGVLGLGPARLETDLFFEGDVVVQRPISGVLSWQGRPMGPVSTGLTARVDAVGEGSAPWTLAAPEARVLLEGGARVGHDLGPAHVEARLDAIGRRWTDGEAWGEGRATGRLSLPMWAAMSPGTLELEAGLEGSGALTVGSPELRWLDGPPPPAWSLGPSLGWRRVTASGVPLSGWVALPWTADGLLPQGGLRIDHGALNARVQADVSLQQGEIGWDDGSRRLVLGAAHAEELSWLHADLGWTLPAPLVAWRPGWRGAYDAVNMAFLSQGPSLRYRSPCDCLEAEARATWSQDRTRPDLGFNLKVW